MSRLDNAAPRPGRPTSVLVTGASTGIGRACAAAFAAAGHRVVGTSRDPGTMKPADRLDGVEYLPLSLVDPASVGACAEAAGPVDVLVNNAGQSQLGALEDTAPEAIEDLFAVNVFGTIRLTQLVLPGMRERHRGTVVMVGSLLAEFPLAYRSAYVASKCALRGFTLAARKELEPFGVRLTIVEPAYYRSALAANRTVHRRPDSPYAAGLAAVQAATARGDAKAGDPADVAKKVVAIAAGDDPAPLYAVGGVEPALLQLRRLLSHRATERLLARRYGLGRRA